MAFHEVTAISFFMEDFNMLVLTRKPGEKIHVGSDISITVVQIHGAIKSASVSTLPGARANSSRLN